jgi:hypothetical protein
MSRVVFFTVQQTYLHLVQYVRFKVFISSVFLNVAYIIFEKKQNLRTPFFWDAAGVEFLGGFGNSRSIDLETFKMNMKSLFKTSANTQPHIPEDQKPRRNSCENPQNSKRLCFYFLLDITKILNSHLCWFLRQNFAPSWDIIIFKKSVIVFKLAEFALLMGLTVLKTRGWKCGNLLQ